MTKGDFMKKIDQNWIQPIFLGSVFLGTGGGGKTNNILLMLEELFSNNTTVSLIDFNDINDNSYYASTGLIGSPNVLDDFYFTGQENLSSINKLKEIMKVDISGIYSLECAGANALYPLLTASILDIPIIDGDCTSRTFPEIQMTSLHINNISIAPFSLTDTNNEVHCFHEKDTFMLDLNIRKLLSKKNNIGFFACAMKSGKIIKKNLIPHTYSHAMEIGNAFLESNDYNQLLNKLILITKNSIYGATIELFKGKIFELDNSPSLKWQILNLKGIDSYSNENFKILMKNELLIAFKNDTLAAMVPDLITLIDLDTLLPLNIDELKPQMKVSVLGIPAPVAFKTPSALAVVGPSSFGYKSPYKSLEEIYYDYYY